MFAPTRILSALLGVLLQERSLVICGILSGALIATNAAWLQPALTPGVRGTHISLLVPQDEVDRALRIDSPSVVVLFGLGWALAIALHRSSRFSLAGGIIVATALLAHACVLGNQPVIIERLEREDQQYAQISAVLAQVTAGSAIVDPASSVAWGALPITTGPSNLGLPYLGHSIWLIPLGLVIQFYAGHGPVHRRLTVIAGWLLMGLLLAIPLCRTRLLAEYDWHRARQELITGDAAAARQSLARSIEHMPALGNLARSWFLAGRIDWDKGIASDRRTFFIAQQLRAQRETLAAAETFDALLRSSPEAACVRRAAGEAWTSEGLTRYLSTVGKHTDQDQSVMHGGAITAWQRALQVSPDDIPAQVYTVLAEAQSGGDALRTERRASHLLTQVADPALRADLLATVGDVFFEAGRFQDARHFYAASRQAYEFPKDINFRARTGLVGI